MPKITKQELSQTKIGERLLSEWDLDWESLPTDFKLPRPNLSKIIGLFRAVRNNNVMYIGRASDLKGGLSKGLVRIFSEKEQSGNKGFGAQMLRRHRDELRIDILLVGDDQKSIMLTKITKNLMIKYYKPEWNRPHSWRMSKIHNGERPA